MPSRTYVGDNAAVVLRLPDGDQVTVARGETVEVPADLAKEMDASAAWSKPKTEHPKTDKES